MSERTCSVEGCGKKVHARDLCHRHYGRWLTRGSTEDLVFEPRTCVIEGCDEKVYAKDRCQPHYRRYRAEKDQESGKIFPECSVEDCNRRERHLKRGLCNKHYRRWFRGDASIEVRDVAVGEGHPRWKGGVSAYDKAHVEVIKVKGHASDYECVTCGECAADWAYDHEDPDEKVGSGRRAFSYSDDPDHYHPMCRPCHVKFDRGTVTLRSDVELKDP